MKSYIKRVFGLDYRSLALLRIGVGLTILFDLIQRVIFLNSHYSDYGVLTRSELLRLNSEPTIWSFHMFSGSSLFIGILFIIAFVFAVMMIVGYRTRLAVIVSFLFLISLQNRNLLVLQGGDVALRVILFWMMFLPLAKRFALDKLKNEEPQVVAINDIEKKNYFGIPAIIYTLQFLSIYAFSGFLKDGAPWIKDFTAVQMALALDIFLTPIGVHLRSMTALLPYLTIITILTERFTSLLFFSPIKTQWVRLIGIILFNAMIIGFNLSFRLGLFGMIMISISLGLLPSVFWDKIIKSIRMFFSKKSKIGWTIYYDGDCGFCLNMVNVIFKILFLNPNTIILPSDKDQKANQLLQSENSWVIKDKDGNYHTRFGAFVSLMRSSSFFMIFAPIFAIKPVHFIGDKIYILVASHRPMTCITPMIQTKKVVFYKNKKFFRNIILIILFSGVCLWNVRTMPKFKTTKINRYLEKVMLVLKLDQKWSMFAPYPATEDGWYVIPANLRDGTKVDLYTGSVDISYDKPKMMSQTYPDQRWQKYLMNLWLKDYSDYRLGYGRYLCRKWNDVHPYEKNVMTFSVTYMLEDFDTDTLAEKPIVPTIIWNHHCFESPDLPKE